MTIGGLHLNKVIEETVAVGTTLISTILVMDLLRSDETNNHVDGVVVVTDEVTTITTTTTTTTGEEILDKMDRHHPEIHNVNVSPTKRIHQMGKINNDLSI